MTLEKLADSWRILDRVQWRQRIDIRTLKQPQVKVSKLELCELKEDAVFDLKLNVTYQIVTVLQPVNPVVAAKLV